MSHPKPAVVANPWGQLRQFTAARIALGRTGASLPTKPQLVFQLAHARARDAVHRALDVPGLLADFHDAGLGRLGDSLVLDSAAADRLEYLQRPDLGRRLSDDSRERLATCQTPATRAFDIAFVVADGLSSFAVAQHAPAVLTQLMRDLADEHHVFAPIIVVRQARVAIGDEVGALLGAKLVVVLIGERPGLSSPDSMGAYLTWMPRRGMTDASRNCISNIRPDGLPCREAARKMRYLISQMQRRQLSGVSLKDESLEPDAPLAPLKRNFLPGND